MQKKLGKFSLDIVNKYKIELTLTILLISPIFSV